MRLSDSFRKTPEYKNSISFLSSLQSKTARTTSSIPERLAPYPALTALYVAVWEGDISLFPQELIEFYKSTGTLAVLALSGEHVWVLVTVLTSMIAIISKFSFLFFKAKYCALFSYFPKNFKNHIPVLCASILLITSHGNSSALRTFGLFSSYFFLKSIGKNSTKLQVLTTSTAFLFCLEPTSIFQTGFILSFLGVYNLFVMDIDQRWKIVLLPLSFFPFLSHFFGEISLVAPFVSFLIDFIWTTVWIPLGFLLPYFTHVMGMSFVLSTLEKSLLHFIEGHEWCGALMQRALIRVPVLDLQEVIVIEFWIHSAALYFLKSSKKEAI